VSAIGATAVSVVLPPVMPPAVLSAGDSIVTESADIVSSVVVSPQAAANDPRQASNTILKFLIAISFLVYPEKLIP
jgi:hypothetical protein